MRVLILSQYFWPENFRLNDAALELSRRGHKVTVLTGLPNYPNGTIYPAYNSDPAQFSSLNGIEIVRVPLMARRKGTLSLIANYLSFAASAMINGAWKLRRRDFDVALVFQPSPATIGLPAVVLRALKRVPTVFWVQDLWPETLAAVGALRSPALLAIVGKFMRWVFAHCDHVIAQSRSLRELLIERVQDPHRVSYLPNWSAPSYTSESQSEALRHATFNVFYLGNIGHAQDFPSVIAAMSSLREQSNIHWHFVGDGRLLDWLRTTVRAAELRECVHFHGPHPEHELHRFYSQADALLVSLRDDPIFAMTVPSKLQSYFEQGIPVVAMLNGEGANLVREARAGIAVPAGDHKKLANAVLELAAMPDAERRAMGLRARAFSREHFSFSHLMNRLEQILVDTGMSRIDAR